MGEPDWSSGIEFGKQRNAYYSEAETEKYRVPTKTLQKKLDAIEVKREKLFDKLKKSDNKSIEVKVKTHSMGNIYSVDFRQALKLLDEAKDNLMRSRKDTGGIIVYV